MCRMIGIVSLPSVPPQLFLGFRDLATHGRYLTSDGPSHHDGWGAGWFRPNNEVQLVKAATPVQDRKSGYIDALVRMGADQPRIAVAHLRKASTGGVRTEDTHPFAAGGWLFCHNGTLFEHQRLPLHTHQPDGGTDSERLFLYLLEQMAGDIEEGVRRTVETTRGLRYSSLTFLLTDGRVLVAYRDVGQPDGATLKESRRYYTLYALFRADMCIVCSEPMSFCGQSWKQLDDGELLIVSKEAQLLRRVNLRAQLAATNS